MDGVASVSDMQRDWRVAVVLRQGSVRNNPHRGLIGSCPRNVQRILFGQRMQLAVSIEAGGRVPPRPLQRQCSPRFRLFVERVSEYIELSKEENSY